MTNYTIKDINTKRLKNEYIRGYKLKRISEPYTSAENALVKFNLLREEKITNASIVLFGKHDFVNCKEVRYANSSALTILDLHVALGNIYDCAESAIDYINSRITWYVEFEKIRRINVPKIPIEIIRELVVNIFLHCDYSYKAIENKIAIYPNQISIQNPGHFRYETSPKAYADNKAALHRLNPTIATVINKTGMIESEGYGLRKVYIN